MTETFAEILTAGGKMNSLGRVNEVIAAVLQDKNRLEALYQCLFVDDAWVRMRAADAIEKICREHPEWIEPYIDRFNAEIADSTQPSIQWHLAEMYAEVNLTPAQKQFAIDWLVQHLSTKEVDWIVAANSMRTLVQFTKDGSVPKAKTVTLLKVQQKHKSNAIVKKATSLLEKL